MPLRKRSIAILSIVIVILFIAHRLGAQDTAPAAHAGDAGLALTPPTGWYPWNEFGQEPQNEQLIKEIVDALVSSGLKEAGYAYVGPDEGICFSRDASGKLTSNLERYPSGLRGLSDYIHKKGLKYALYTDAGTRTCSKAMPGTKDHEFEDMEAFAEWRADYVKIDWCNTQGQDVAKSYTKLGEALRASGRPIVFSLCSWGQGEPWKWAASVGNLWRTTGDICAPGKADWNNAMKVAAANEKLYEAAGPGHWNDPDMMIAGMAGLSATQNRSFFSLWCMMAAPLMAGNDLRKMTASTVQILTNLEAIGINQDPLGTQGRIVRSNGKVEIWAGKRLFDGSQAVLVFNQGAAPAHAQVAWPDIGLAESAAMYVRNLWAHQTTGPYSGGVSVTVEPNDVALLRISKANTFPVPPIIVADTYLVSLHGAGSTAQKLTGTVTVKTNGSDTLPLWKVRQGLPSWLSVAVTRNGKSQTLTNTASTAGLKKGLYHALVRADNIEPVSGRLLSALYYDVDLEITGDAGGCEKH
jgi:alpha-galactosidase